jgi:hypothetical protein
MRCSSHKTQYSSNKRQCSSGVVMRHSDMTQWSRGAIDAAMRCRAAVVRFSEAVMW